MSSSLVAGSRVGERENGAASGADSFARAFRASALLGSAAVLWAFVALGSALLVGRIEATATLFVAGPLLLVGGVLTLWRVTLPAGCAAVGLAFGVAGIGHVLGPNLDAFDPIFLGVGLVIPALGILALPLISGWRTRALDLALRATGRRPRGLPLRALTADEGDELLVNNVTAKRAALGALRAWLDGWTLPGLVALDLAHRLRPGHVERVHVDADLARLERAYASVGATTDLRARSLVLQLPNRSDRVGLRRHRLAFPRGEQAFVIEISGPRAAAHEARRLLETELAHVGRFAWTAQGLRWEARLNALIHDAHDAASMEERSALLEEAARVERLLDARDLMGDERQLLRGWKAQRLRILLSNKLLSEPVGPRGERALAPAPALAPELSMILDAGGLSSLRRLVFVPHWIVPVRTPWGEQEVVVNALTHKADIAAGLSVLRAARERGASLFVVAPRGVQFLSAPEPNASVLKTIREAGVKGKAAYDSGSAMEIIYVPFVPSDDGYHNAVTGEAAADMGPAPTAAMRA